MGGGGSYSVPLPPRSEVDTTRKECAITEVIPTNQLTADVQAILARPHGPQWTDLPNGQGQQIQIALPNKPVPPMVSPWVAMDAWNTVQREVHVNFQDLVTAVADHATGTITLTQSASPDLFMQHLHTILPQVALQPSDRAQFPGFEADTKRWTGWTARDGREWAMPQGFVAVSPWDDFPYRQVGVNWPAQAVLIFAEGDVSIHQFPDPADFTAHCADIEHWVHEYDQDPAQAVAHVHARPHEVESELE